jgi:hypothetical protein
LRWRYFDINTLKFTDELTPLLLRLPSLERLDADLSRCSRFEFLAALPRLTHLHLSLWDIEAPEWRNLLGVFTSDGLARLHTLHLFGGPCSDYDLVKLLSHIPTLTRLSLCELVEVDSLAVFRQLPKLADTLTQLMVQSWRQWRLTAYDLRQLLALQQLRVLRLLDWPKAETDRLTAADRAPFEQRPCAVLPHLELFQWTPRR